MWLRGCRTSLTHCLKRVKGAADGGNSLKRLLPLVMATATLWACGSDGDESATIVPGGNGGGVLGAPSAEQHAYASRHSLAAGYRHGQTGLTFVVIPGPWGAEKALYMQTTETTRKAWLAYVEHGDGQLPRKSDAHEDWSLTDRPATALSSAMIEGFASWMGQSDPAHAYRMPSLAEWQVACSAGASGEDRSAIVDLYPRIRDDWGTRDHFPVDYGPANEWGLHGMAGSVWELCRDSRGILVRCGGASLGVERVGCDVVRHDYGEEQTFWTFGFRLVATPRERPD